MPLFCRLILSLVLLSPLRAGVVPHGLPDGYARAPDLAVSVNGTAVPVLAVLPQYDYTHFSGDGPLEVTVTAQEPIRSWSISPLAAAIPAKVEGNRLSFTLTRPAYLIVKLNERRELAFAGDPPETDAPPAAGPGIFRLGSAPYAADPTGRVLATAAVQAAIDNAASAGGGTVYVPAGVFTCGNLTLRSKVSLYIASGAVLRSSGNPADFTRRFTKHSLKMPGTWFIQTEPGAQDMRIHGRGTIDGNARELRGKNRFLNNLVVPLQASRFTLEGVVLLDSGLWGVIPTRSDHVTIANTKHFNEVDAFHENDAVDLIESQHVRVERVFAISEDDTFSTKTWEEKTDLAEFWPGAPEPLEDVVFANCLAWSRCATFKVGFGCFQPQRRIVFRDSTSYRSMRAVALNRSWGLAPAEDIVFENIDVEGFSPRPRDAKICRWLDVNTGSAAPARRILFKDIRVRDVGLTPSRLQGFSADARVEDITFHDIVVRGQPARSLADLNVGITNAFLANVKFEVTSGGEVGAAQAAPGEKEPDFRSRHLAVSLALTSPAFSVFGADSLGRGENLENVLLTAKVPAGDFMLQREGDRFTYRRGGRVVWTVELQEAKIILRSSYAGFDAPAFLLLVDQKKNHATLLARPEAEAGKFAVPAVLHFPDRGTFRVTATAGATLEADARRRQPEFFVRVGFPAATAQRPEVEYVLESTLIHPDLPGLADQPLYDGYRRNFLNLIQFHPRLRTLANNSSSDTCGFCFWQYAELAREAPPLAPGLTVMDLVRISLERVFTGGLTYGQAGYAASPEQPEAAPWSPPFDSLDTLPSFVIAGSLAITEGGAAAWSEKRFADLVALARRMLAQDRDGNGLIEYPLSGNSGSWDGSVKTRPANWWDTVGFGHEDGFANALAYRACLRLAEAAGVTGRAAEAKEFAAAAAKIKRAYYPALFNPRTGILAGWKSADGELHDHWFTFINGMAIAFGLVEGKEADAILDRLLAKMDEVGFRRFDLGLPGNLVFIPSKDYTDRRRKYGGSEHGDGSENFQIYENGAATHCHAHWLVQALYRQGRVADARRIYHPMLRTFAAGGFQGFGENGLSRDWRSWEGVCSGYEGYLTDGYLALLGVRQDLAAGQ